MRLPASTLLLAALAAIGAVGAVPVGAQLTVRLAAPPATPAGVRVHVAGSFNGWSPGDTAYALARQPDGAWSITLPDRVRGGIEYKFTLGSWETVELAAGGGGVENRRTVVRAAGADTVVATVAAWRDGSPPVAAAPSRTRSVRVASDSFAIPQLGRTRRVWVYLPPGYAGSTRRYPVLYMQDGQNVFDAATSFSGEWGVDESLDSLRARGARGAIVVAVDHGGPRRLDEYNPWRAADPRHGGGEGDAYVAFLAATLKPWIDRRYRTRPEPRYTGIMGSSMGGLIALRAALARPDVFGRAGIFSCACWIADPQVFAAARQAGGRLARSRLYFVAGDLETADGSMVRDQRRVIDTLLAAGAPPAALRALAAPDGRHAEWFWRREFPAAYAWLFDDAPPAPPRPARRR